MFIDNGEAFTIWQEGTGRKDCAHEIARTPLEAIEPHREQFSRNPARRIAFFVDDIAMLRPSVFVLEGKQLKEWMEAG